MTLRIRGNEQSSSGQCPETARRAAGIYRRPPSSNANAPARIRPAPRRLEKNDRAIGHIRKVTSSHIRIPCFDGNESFAQNLGMNYRHAEAETNRQFDVLTLNEDSIPSYARGRTMPHDIQPTGWHKSYSKNLENHSYMRAARVHDDEGNFVRSGRFAWQYSYTSWARSAAVSLLAES